MASLLDAIRRETQEAPTRHLRQHGGTLIFDIHRRNGRGEYIGVRSLRFNAATGFWEEHGKRVLQLSHADVAYLNQAAPWTVARYVARY
jgi:hypothetical protein